ncbi:MAG: flagellar hook-length control protein FliK [Planctomycetota bacterium]|jgi:flagellar hook-length control protein FliK
MKNGLASSMEGSGQLLLKLVNSGKNNIKSEAGKSDGVSFKDLVKSVINSSKSSKAQKTGGKEQKNTGSGNLEEGSETQGWYTEMPQKEAAAARDRLQTLVDDGSLRTEELDSMSVEELKELLAWLLSGANGLFAPHEEVEVFSGQTDEVPELQADSISALEPAFTGLDMLAFEEGQGRVLEEGQSRVLEEGAEKVISHEDSSRILDFLNLDNLSAEESRNLEESLTQLLKTAGKNIVQQGDSAAVAADSEKGALQDILSNMSKDEIVDLLRSASENIGKPEVFESGTDLKELPKAVIQALSVKILKVEHSEDEKIEDNAERLLSELDAKSPKISLRNENNSYDRKGEIQEKPAQLSDNISADDIESGDENPVGKLSDEIKAIKREADDMEVKPENRSEQAKGILEELKPVKSVFSDSESKVFKIDGTDDLISEMGKTADSKPAVQQKAVVPERYVDTNQNIEKISQVMKLNVRRGISTATLQLAPAELGKVKLQISVQGGIMNASVKAESADARNMLMANVGQLRDTLTSQGIKFGEFDIYYENDETSQNSPEDFTNHFSRRRGSNSRQSAVFGAEEEAVEEKIGVIGDGFVNMIA